MCVCVGGCVHACVRACVCVCSALLFYFCVCVYNTLCKLFCRTMLYMCIEYHIYVNVYHVSAQGIDERMINVHHYYYYYH